LNGDGKDDGGEERGGIDRCWRGSPNQDGGAAPEARLGSAGFVAIGDSDGEV
jgi:hypothetical protein